MNYSPEVKKAIKDLVEEVSNSMTRQEAERDFIKEAIKNIAEEHGLDKKVLRRMCRTYHKQKFFEEKSLNEEFEIAYETVFNIGDDD